jgi:Ca2+-binding RTX toxin-like protein
MRNIFMSTRNKIKTIILASVLSLTGLYSFFFVPTASAFQTNVRPIGAPKMCQGKSITIWGSPASETINGTNQADVIWAGFGDDTVNGKRGNDTICGGPGKDTLNGNQGKDSLFGGLGNDKLRGNAGNDVLRGGAGSDSCDGGAGNNTLVSC